MRADVVEVVFAGAVLIVFGSAAALALGRCSRAVLWGLGALIAACAAAAWVVFALEPGRDLAVAAAGLTVCAVFELGLLALQTLLERNRDFERRLAEAQERLDDVVRNETETRARELERTLTLARAESLSLLVEEERRMAEERRAALHERERTSGAELSDAMAKVEDRVRRRLSDWKADLERIEESLAVQLATLGQRQEQLIAEAASRLVLETERLDEAGEEQRARLETLAADFERSSREAAERAHAELEAHESERRRALHEVADRLRDRERELRTRIETEESDATQRIQAGFADVERRQVDHLKRIVERTSGSFSEALAVQFAAEIKNAREDAAKRLGRELDKAVAYFAREAQTVLAEQLSRVADAGGQRLEHKLTRIGSSLEHEQRELTAELERQIGDAEVKLRSHVKALAADAEAERTALTARLNELQRRIETLGNEAESRLAPTYPSA